MYFANYKGKTIERLYGDVANEPSSYGASHWSTKDIQHSNFKAVAAVLDDYKLESILDVGSGLGDLRDFLPDDIEYKGIDITPEIVERADEPDITLADIKTYEPGRTFDAVVALGSFNMATTFPQVKESLEAIYKLTNLIAVVTISYIDPFELESLALLGWKVTTNPHAFNDGYGDKHILTRLKLK